MLVRFLLLLLLLAPLPSRAQDAAADPLTLIASSDFDDVQRGIGLLATSGNPHAAAILQALSDGELYTGPDQKLLIHRGDAYLDAATEQPVADVADDAVTNVPVNNAVRRATEAAMGSLSLFSSDTAVRARAAEAVF